jgi:2-oxoglutarate ferredoxin oxidoreductase subunit alpha
VGGTCIQAEDEIAAIGFCLGASMAGLKVMTATSGPGISLFSENISFATGSEIPIVIVDVQRLGPSTGSATLGAEGDIQFLRWGNSGGFPVVVLAPADAADCYLLTQHAFNIAELYRCPVFLASNKEIGMTRESIRLDALKGPEPLSRRSPPPGAPYLPFGVEPAQVVPDFLPIGGPVPVRQTSSTHGPDGYITSDPEQIADCRRRLNEKLATVENRFNFFEYRFEERADALLITYGVSARAARDVWQIRKKQGKPISLLILKTLWPAPETLLRQAAQSHDSVWVLEMNLGQYVREIERVISRPVRFIGEMNGRLVSPETIETALSHG